MSRQYNDDHLELEIEYTTGEKNLLFALIQYVDPLAVAHYTIDSTSSTSNPWINNLNKTAKHKLWSQQYVDDIDEKISVIDMMYACRKNLRNPTVKF